MFDQLPGESVIGSKSPTTQSSSVNAPTDQGSAALTKALNTSTRAASTPFQAYTGELTAGVNGQEQGAISATNNLGTATNQNLGVSSGLAAASTGAINPTAINGATISQYENPYQNDVIAATMAQIQNQNKQQQEGQTSSAISAGAFGGDRAGVAQAALANQQDLASNATLANLNSQNYTQALNEANTQQQTTLSADQANRAALATGSQLYAGLGSLASSTGIANTNAQLQGGLLQQQTAQAGDTANYGQFENQQAYPFQTAAFLSGITGSLVPELGGTSSGTQVQSAPSPLNSIIGGGLGVAGLLSDERAKEDIKPIGKTFDGSMLYSFRYKGHPETHVGYLAHEVERKHPEAVSQRADGLKVVDYAEATRKAAEKGHFARGGRAGDLTFQGLGQVRRYASGGMTEMPYGDAGGYVPSVGLAAAHAPQFGSTSPSPTQPQASATDPSMQNLLTGAKQFGSSSLGQGLGDSISDFAQDSLGLATGGRVIDLGLARARRGYDGGGVVSDPAAMTFDPNAFGDPLALGPLQPGLGSASMPNPNTLVPPPAPAVPNLPSDPAPGLGAAALQPDPNAGAGLGAAAPVPVAPASNVTPVIGYKGPDGSTTPAPSQGLAAANPSGIDPNAGGLGAINKAAPPAPAFSGGFDASVNRTLGFEGGYNPNDANGTPSNFGINQAAHPGIDVSKLTKDQAKAIYKSNYWDAIGGDNLPPALAHVAFDTSVIAGPQRAKDMIAQSGGDPNKFMDLRDAYLKGLVTSNPDKYGQYAKTWADRNAALRSDINGGSMPPSALAYSGSGSPPAASSGLGAAGLPSSGTSTPASSSFSDNFGGLIGGTGKPSPDHSGGILGLFPGLSDNERLGLAAAGFGMAASPSRSWGQAIGQGGLQGIKDYQNAQKIASQQGLARAQVANLQSEITDRPLARAQSGTEVESKVNEMKLKLAQFGRQMQAAREAGDIATTPTAISSASSVLPPAANQPQPVVPGNPSASPVPASAAAPTPPMPPSNGSTPASPPLSVSAPSGAANPTTTTPSPPTQDGDFWSKADPNYNPFLLNGRADAIDRQAQVYRRYGQTDAANTLSQQATALRARVDGMSGKPVVMRDGTYQFPPSYIAATNAQKQGEMEAGERGKSGTQNFDMNRPIYEKAAADKDTAYEVKANAQTLRNLVFDPNGNVAVDTGPQGEWRAALAAQMKQSKIFSDDIIKKFTETDPSKAEAVQKLSTDMVAEVARQSIGPGNRLDQTEYRNMIKGVPNNQILPETIKFLTDRVLIPKSNWAINRFGSVAGSDLHSSNLQQQLFHYDQQHPLDQAINPNPNRPAAPAEGDVLKGYRFLGGDPRVPTSWQKAQ